MGPLNLSLEVRGGDVSDLKYEKNARHYYWIEDEEGPGKECGQGICNHSQQGNGDISPTTARN